MNLRFVVLVVFITLFAMVGLILIQLQWMLDSYKLGKNNKETAIYEALSTALTDYEKESTLLFFNSNEQLKNVYSKKENFAKKQDKHGNLTYGYKLEDANDGFSKMLSTELNIPKSLLSSVSPEQLEKIRQHYVDFNDKWRNQAKLMLFESMCVDEKIDIDMLKQFINNEFNKRHLSMDYQVCIVDQNTSGIIYTDMTKVDSLVLKSSIKSQLFQNNLFNQVATLFIYFPNKDKALINDMFPMLAASFVFITFILLSFLLTVYTIYKQKKLSDMKSDFINNMTHELKTPVATIGLASKMLQNEKIQANLEKVTNYARVIKQENDRLLNNIEKVIQAARMQKSEIKLKITDVDINMVIEEAVNQNQLNLDEVGGTLTFFNDADRGMIQADKTHITNVINNLIENAIKYRKDTVPLKIHIETLSKRNGINITIEDNAIGIPTDVLEKIFEKFYRVPTGNVHNVKGFGLGLNYVKEMVDAHKGRVSVNSELGVGSIFTIYLPYEHQDQKEQ